MFSLADITLLSSCFAGDIDYMEPDGIVMKAEHVSKPRSSQHPKQAKKSLSSEEQQQRRRLQWLQRRDHQYQQQQQQQQPVPAATDSKLPLPGVQTEERLNTISSRGERQRIMGIAAQRELFLMNLAAENAMHHHHSMRRGHNSSAAAADPHTVSEASGPDLSHGDVPVRAQDSASNSGQHDDGSSDDLAALSQTVDKVGVKTENVNLVLWNLDRLDQRLPPLDGLFQYGTNSTVGTGKGVTIYAIDSGIRQSHQEIDFVNNSSTAEDCDGHGTHGLDWVAQHAQRPAIVMMSLGVSDGVWASSLESSVQSLVRDHGILAVVASGNSAVDACSIAPARCSEALTVAASNMDNKFAASGPPGACVTLFAPGVEIYGACGGPSRCADLSDAAYAWASGTSMAVPHVAGVAAQLLSSWPTATPAQVTFAILQGSTPGRMNDPKILTGTPNRLLYSRADWGEAVVQSSGGN
ncbi:MAG: hypothetical protein WDW38_005246 [Sanguina aurantia]